MEHPGDATAKRVAPGEAARSGRQLLLVHLLNPQRGAAGVGFFRAYREDLVGFATSTG